ncbi:MAG: hypothetical protein ACUZ8E_01530 [Candidatus Anammoxibacter sp.]
MLRKPANGRYRRIYIKFRCAIHIDSGTKHMGDFREERDGRV